MYRPRTLVAVGLTALALAVAGCQSDGGAASTGSSTGGAPAVGGASTAAQIEHGEDVAITACAPQPDLNWVGAKVKVTNNSSKASNYIVTITFESPDGKTQIDTGLVAVNGLSPGQSTDQDAVGTKDAVPGYTCRVSDITRLAA